MKKLLSVLFTVIFVFAAVTVITSAAYIQKDADGIYQTNFLDFTKDTNDLWASYDEETGSWKCDITFNSYEQPEDADGNLIGPYVRDYSSFSARSWSLIENGEVLHLECTVSSVYPGISFIIDEYHTNAMLVGSASGSTPKAEYVKIRVRNHSTADQITFAFCHGSTNQFKFMEKSLSELTVDVNGKRYASSGEWQTYIFSMATINMETNYGDLLYDSDDPEATPTHCWSGGISEFLIFPFGYNVTDGTGAYPGAAIDIDYIVIGSLDYVTNYKSALEVKEESISKLELIKAPTKTSYRVGEALDLDGLELKATYKDGTSEILNTASANVATFSTVDAKEVTLSFGSERVSFPVSVTGISSIEVIEEPESKIYEAAELEDSFVTDGFKFKVNYTDGSFNDTLPATIFRYTGDFVTPGVKTISANYFTESVDFEIEVMNVTDLEITAPTKAYRYGNVADIADFGVTLVFGNGEKIASGDATTEFEYTVTLDTKVPGEAVATIVATNTTYDITITKEVTVNVEVPTEIVVTKEPTKLVYQPGDEFNPEGMTVALVYADGKQIKLDAADYTCRVDTSEPGEKRVSVRSAIEGLDLRTNLNITVEGEVVTPTTPTNTSATTTAPKTSDGGVSPIIFVVIGVIVVAAAVVVVLVVLKKKKK
jgi:hypothetical protein